MKRLLIIISIIVVVLTGLIYLYSEFSNADEVEPFTNPHGNYASDTGKCGKCHSGHSSAGTDLLGLSSIKETCYACHSGGNSSPNVRAELGEVTLGSSVYDTYHPIPSGIQLCTTCHNPHLATEDSPGGTASLLAVGPSKISSGNTVCEVCHGSGSTAPGGDMITRFVYSAHDTNMNAPSSGTQIKCIRCHQPHGSTYDSLLRTSIVDQVYVPHDVTGNNNTVCFACHINGLGNYSGMTVFGATYHGSKTSSTVALTVYPETDYSATMCLNCHEPHGKTGLPKYKRAEGNQLCIKCHDDSGLPPKPDIYSYRGLTAYNSTPHATMASTNGYTLISTGAKAWQSNAEPTPFSPGTPATTTQLSTAAGNDFGHWSTNLVSADGAYNYQMYKFHITQDPADVVRLNCTWKGYGTPTPNYYTDLYIWNALTDTWELLDSQQLASDGTLAVSKTSNTASYIDASNDVYLMARTKHDGIVPVITGGPTVTGVVVPNASIYWTTDEYATSYVDWGLTTSYGNTAGNGTGTYETSHTVTINGLTQGNTYHYRVRSTDRLGNEKISEDFTFLTSLPPNDFTVIAQPDYVEDSTTRTVTLQWNATTDPESDPVQYYVEISTDSSFNTIYNHSSWQAGTSWSTSIYNSGGTIQWYWRVRAKDNHECLSNWTSADDFLYTYNPPPPKSSCPFTFVWNGKEYIYVSDMAGSTINLPKTTRPKIYSNILPYYLPAPQLVPDVNNQYRVKLWSTASAEMDIIDQYGLLLIDHPPGYEILSSSGENSSTLPKGFKKKFYAIKDTILPIKATDKFGRDVTKKLSALDNDVAVDKANRFGPDYYVLDFGKLKHPEYAKLILDGWAHNPMFFGKPKEIPRVEVINKKGQWETFRRIGDISGDKKSMVIDLSGAFKTDDHRIRIFVGIPSVRVILDRVRLDQTPPIPLKKTYVPASSAQLYFRGSSKLIPENFDHSILMTNKLRDKINYRYYGKFTKYGDVAPLLAKADDMFVVMQHGDEIQLKFDNIPLEKGLERTPMVVADFYYKVNGTQTLLKDIKVPVEPLPFHGMSKYPYPKTEKYPDDPAHNEYRAKWLTREYKLVDGQVVPVNFNPDDFMAPNDTPVKDSLWTRFTHFLESLWTRFTEFLKSLFGVSGKDAAKQTSDPANRTLAQGRTGSLSSAEKPFAPEKHYSLNTNYIYIKTNTTVGTGVYTINSTGSDAWQSGTDPTPSDPGTQVTSGQKTAVATDDASLWTTDLAVAEGAYNSQMYNFIVNNGVGAGTHTLSIIWKGYGEPTAAHPVSFYLWNFNTSSWDQIKEQQISTQTSLPIIKSDDFATYCDKCHDNTPPSGVVMGGTRNIASTFTNDVHGGASGPMGYSNGSIDVPYSRVNSPISCVDCHDPHGSTNAYHFRENLNGQSGKSVPDTAFANNAQVTTYCQSCHVGTIENFHASCIGCHRSPDHASPPWDADFGRACTSCHYHGASFGPHGSWNCGEGGHCGTVTAIKAF